MAFVVGRPSWYKYWCHDVCICWAWVVGAFGSLRCSWDTGSVKVALNVDSASSRLLFGRCLSPLCRLACITVSFSMCMRVRTFGVLFIQH